MSVPVTLLTKADCHLCDHAKEVLRRVAPDYGLYIDTVDLVTERGQRIAQHAGMLFPPALLIDGQPFCFGRLSERRLRRELDRRRSRSTPTGAAQA